MKQDKEHREYIFERHVQYQDQYDELYKQYERKRKTYEYAAQVREPIIFLALRAIGVLFLLGGLLLDAATNSSHSWFAASGALITLMGLGTQLHRAHLNTIVTDMLQIMLERDTGHSLYYSFRTQLAVQKYLPLTREEELVFFRINSAENKSY